MTLGAAGIAAFAHSAQRRSSALDNGAPRVRLCRRQRVGAPVRCARAQDAGQRGPLHGRSSSEPTQQVEWTVLCNGTGARQMQVALRGRQVAVAEQLGQGGQIDPCLEQVSCEGVAAMLSSA